MRTVSAVLCTVMLSVAMVTVQGLNDTDVSRERNLTRTVMKEICAGYSIRQLRTLYTRFHKEYSLEVPKEGLFRSLSLATPVAGDRVQFTPSAACPDATPANTMWCLRLAIAATNATMCLKPGGGVLASQAGELLKLATNMAVEPESGSLVIKNVTKMYAYTLVSAISRTEGCTTVAHTAIYVRKKTNIPPTLIEFPSDTKVAAGQAVSLNCTFSTSSGYHYLHWYKDGKDIPLILENPNCQELNDSVCRTDVRYPDDHSIRMSNVRSYMYSQQFCLQDSVHRHAHLVIDRAELGDAGKYTCKLFNISSDEPLQSVTVTLQVE